MWSRDGKEIYYHGGYVHSGFCVGRVDPQSVPDGKKPAYTEIRLPDGYRKYGHFTEGSNGMLVTDGYYQEDEQRKQAVFISVLKPQWEKKEILWKPLCRHDSGWSGQDAHPHPIFNHKSDRVYFTSDFEGPLKAYWVEVGE